MSTKSENSNSRSELDSLLSKWHTTERNPEYRDREYNNLVKQLQDFIQNNQFISIEEFCYGYINHTIYIDFIPTSNAFNTLGKSLKIHIHLCPEVKEAIFRYLQSPPIATYGKIKLLKKADGNEYIEFGINEIDKVYRAGFWNFLRPNKPRFRAGFLFSFRN